MNGEWAVAHARKTPVITMEGLQALEGRIDLGQRAIRALPVAIGVKLGDCSAPGDLELIGPRAGRQAESAEVGAGVDGGGHGDQVKKCDVIRRNLFSERIITAPTHRMLRPGHPMIKRIAPSLRAHVAALLLAATSALQAAATPQASPAPAPPTPSAEAAPADAPSGEFSELYRIGVDDRVQVSVWRNPELSVTVPVRPDGRISVPLVGDVMAGGRAPQEVAADIESRLAAFVRDPKVAVILVDLRSHEFISRVRVTGAVRQPVSVPYRQGMTVLDAVLQAGGVSDFAAANRSRLHRRDARGRVETREIRLGDILEGGKLESNIDVRPGDVITVPERAL